MKFKNFFTPPSRLKSNRYYKLTEVIKSEDEFLEKRRQQMFGIEDAENLKNDKFGIAFSGGGIRSASVCLGIVKVFNQMGILKKADYLSSVSGGGYTNAYVQATIKKENEYSKLVDVEFLARMRGGGADYMSLGNSFTPYLNVASTILIGLLNPLIFFSVFALIYYFISLGLNSFYEVDNALIEGIIRYLTIGIGVIYSIGASLYYFFKINYLLFKAFNYVVLFFGIITLFCAGYNWANSWIPILESYLPNQIWQVVLLFIGLVALGFFTNINSISLGRIYGDSLANSFLHFDKTILLKDLCKVESQIEGEDPCIAPYPLFNCCLNTTVDSGDGKSSDYYLLSPKFCGSLLTNYIKTNDYFDYRKLTATRAMSTSAAAVNTGMGALSNIITSIVIGLFNFRMGSLLPNPLRLKKDVIRPLWWPIYYFRSMLSTNNIHDRALDISDGGHIENLAVLELLRRRCKLIIGIDSGMDGEFGFEDLRNLIRRARNELGIEIRFKEGEDPFEKIRPGRNGFSEKRFAVADLYLYWERIFHKDENGKPILDKNGKQKIEIKNYGDAPLKIGTYIYIKSSIVAPKGQPNIDRKKNPLQYVTYKYKTYNYDFPHQSTSDQSFDPIQFQSYYELGRFLSFDVLGVNPHNLKESRYGLDTTRKEVFDLFEKNIPLNMETKNPDKKFY